LLNALDYDDMCFVSLAHPSAPLVAAALAASEVAGASGRALLEGYVAGFEVEGALGRIMNPLTTSADGIARRRSAALEPRPRLRESWRSTAKRQAGASRSRPRVPAV
jgi:hypothetical protein